MPKNLIIVITLMCIGAWFLIDEKRSFYEKLGLIILVMVVYVSFHLMIGASLPDILAPLLKH